jgi:hypothetical protein
MGFTAEKKTKTVTQWFMLIKAKHARILKNMHDEKILYGIQKHTYIAYNLSNYFKKIFMEKSRLNIKCMFCFSLQRLFKHFLL